MQAQRFVSNNPQALCTASGIVRVPQQAVAPPRRSGEPLLDDTSRVQQGAGIGYGDPLDYGADGLTSNHHSTRNLSLERMLYHPTLGNIVYPKNPDNTLNYYRSAIRGYDVNSVKTLRSNLLIRDQQKFEDVTVTEIWKGGSKRVSELSEFLDSLQLLLMTEPALGRYMGWIPKDLGFQRHMIYPISLTVGGRGFDAVEARQRVNTSRDSYIIGEIKFEFRLVRPQPLIDSLLVIEGA